jgi:hypothetical protein
VGQHEYISSDAGFATGVSNANGSSAKDSSKAQTTQKSTASPKADSGTTTDSIASQAINNGTADLMQGQLVGFATRSKAEGGAGFKDTFGLLALRGLGCGRKT